MFQALALSFANHSKLGVRPRLHCSANRLQGFLLLRNPMQRIEGDDHIEVFAVRQAASVRDFKAEVWANRSMIVTRCEFDHLVRRIDAKDRGV